MTRRPHNLFLHFLNKDTQDIFKISNYVNAIDRLAKCLNQAVLLCDSDTFCVIPPGFWFESQYTRELLKKYGEYLRCGYLRLAMRDNSLEDYIEKKREQYIKFRALNEWDSYIAFFDNKVLEDLRKIEPVFIDREGRIGKECKDQWNRIHIEYKEENKGELVPIYTKIDNKTLSKQLTNKVKKTAENESDPFVWGEISKVFQAEGLNNSDVEKKVRQVFEKHYYELYKKIYDARLLLNAYHINQGIDFGLFLQEDSISNYRWFEYFLRYNNIAEILDAPNWKICEIKDHNWAGILNKYVEICNQFDENQLSFDATCNEMLRVKDNAFIEAIHDVKEIMVKEEPVIVMPDNNGKVFKNKKDRNMDTHKPSVFISYNSDSSAFVDKIEDSVKEYTKVYRYSHDDSTGIKAWGSFTEFMKKIRVQDYAIIVITQKFLQSDACMFEMLELEKDLDSLKSRAMYVVMDDAKEIYDVVNQPKYIMYWNDRYNNLSKSIEVLTKEQVGTYSEKLKTFKNISEFIGIFMNRVADSNNPNKDEVIAKIIERINLQYNAEDLQKAAENALRNDDIEQKLDRIITILKDNSSTNNDIIAEIVNGRDSIINKIDENEMSLSKKLGSIITNTSNAITIIQGIYSAASVIQTNSGLLNQLLMALK